MNHSREALDEWAIDWRYKSFPPAADGMPAAAIADAALSVVEDFSTRSRHCARRRPASATAVRRVELKLKIEALFDYNDQTYGYRRLHAELVRGGELPGSHRSTDTVSRSAAPAGGRRCGTSALARPAAEVGRAQPGS